MHDTAVRVYFSHSRKAPRSSFLRRLVAPGLARAIVLAAHKAGISQAITYRVTAGYLRGERMSTEHAEVTMFVDQNRDFLAWTNTMFLKACPAPNVSSERR